MKTPTPKPRNFAIFRASGHLAHELDERQGPGVAARGAVAKRDLARIYPLAMEERASLLDALPPGALWYLADLLHLLPVVRKPMIPEDFQLFLTLAATAIRGNRYRAYERLGGQGQQTVDYLTSLSPLQLWVLVDMLEREWDKTSPRWKPQVGNTPDPAMERLEKSYPFRGEHVLP